MSVSLLHDLKGHSGDINCCCWSPVDQVLCSCSGEGALRVWSVPEGKELRQLAAHRFYVNACAYSQAGDLVATASTDTTVKLWSTTSWKTVGEGKMATLINAQVAEHSYCAFIGCKAGICSSMHSSAVLQDRFFLPPPSAHSLPGELRGHDGAVRWCCFSLDGCLLATASSDDSAKVWEVGSQQCVATLTGHNGRQAPSPHTHTLPIYTPKIDTGEFSLGISANTSLPCVYTLTCIRNYISPLSPSFPPLPPPPLSPSLPPLPPPPLFPSSPPSFPLSLLSPLLPSFPPFSLSPPPSPL